jgi:hypothetical protein
MAKYRQEGLSQERCPSDPESFGCHIRRQPSWSMDIVQSDAVPCRQISNVALVEIHLTHFILRQGDLMEDVSGSCMRYEI